MKINEIDNQIREAVAKATGIMITCGKCNGDGWYSGSEAGHGCNGTDEDCRRTCPVQIQVQVGCEECMGSGKYIGRPIQLADILRTIGKEKLIKGEFGSMKSHIDMFLELWDLSKSYEDQKDEVKEFIYSLLINN